MRTMTPESSLKNRCWLGKEQSLEVGLEIQRSYCEKLSIKQWKRHLCG